MGHKKQRNKKTESRKLLIVSKPPWRKYVYEELEPNEAIWFCNIKSRLEIVRVADPRYFRINAKNVSRLGGHDKVEYLYEGTITLPSNYHFVGWWPKERERRWQLNKKREKLVKEFKYMHARMLRKRDYELERLHNHLDHLAHKDMSPIPNNPPNPKIEDLLPVLEKWLGVKTMEEFVEEFYEG